MGTSTEGPSAWGLGLNVASLAPWQVDSFTTTNKEMSKQLADPQPQRAKPMEALPSFGRSSAFTRANQVYVHGDC